MTHDSRAAELAQAEAEAAEAAAAAEQARARAMRLRREVGAAETEPVHEGQAPASAGGDSAADVDESKDADESEKQDDAASTEGAATASTASSPERAWWQRSGLSRLERPRWAAIGAGVAIVAICVSCALISYFVVHHRNVADRQHRAAEYAAAAQQGVITLMSLDYNSAKEDVQRVIDNSTGDFKENFQDTADDFIKVVEQAKVGTETTVKATAVQSMSDDSAVVLVAATSKITNAAGAKQDPRPWRLSVTVTREGDQLKMSKVEFVV